MLVNWKLQGSDNPLPPSFGEGGLGRLGNAGCTLAGGLLLFMYSPTKMFVVLFKFSLFIQHFLYGLITRFLKATIYHFLSSVKFNG